ncbi:MAG: NAD(P)/FAD-dependent oxidoreductase [Methylovirgula sp.]
MAKPHVLVLGGNFAGLGSAQEIRRFCGDAVDITVMDRKNYLLFIPNIPAEVFEGRDPANTLAMPLHAPLADDDVRFIQGEIQALDVDKCVVDFTPSERPGAAPESIGYDYLVVAMGNRLAYDKIEGFAQYGHTLSDFYYGNKLRHFLKHEYKGGPAVVGSALFHQGDGTKDVKLYGSHPFPRAEAACEGPPVETILSLSTWMKKHGKGGPSKITLTTPAEMIAEDAGEEVVHQLLSAAAGMGFKYVNKTGDIKRVTKEGIEFANGQSLEAELKIVFPDWVPHAFMKGLPISDSEGFVITTPLMRNPKYANVMAAGDAAAITVPKLGAIAHQQCTIVGRQIAKDMGRMSAEEADEELSPVVYCIGDMGASQAFYIRSNSWFGGNEQILKMGHAQFLLKMQYKNLFFRNKGKMPDWGLSFSQLIGEKLFA